jgi:hypothetical protein
LPCADDSRAAERLAKREKSAIQKVAYHQLRYLNQAKGRIPLKMMTPQAYR